MGILNIALALSLSEIVWGHGYVKWIGVDNKLYPGFNPHVDAELGAKRIAFGQSYRNHPRYATDNVLLPDIACGSNSVPAKLQATARAGSNVTLGWSTWPITHNGPLISYLGRYTGNLSDTNVNAVNFFKIAELGLLEDRVTWATNVLTANDNLTTVTIPHDIAPGNYLLRHEIITLHFATEDSLYMDSAAKAKGAQHFVTCINLKITGPGTSSPSPKHTVTFPGAYVPGERSLYFDVYRNLSTYPIPGPPLYRPDGPAPLLKENPYEVVMPVGNMVEDMRYFNHMYVQAWKWDGQTFKRNHDSVHGLPDGPNPKVNRACTSKEPCKEDIGGSNPTWGL